MAVAIAPPDSDARSYAHICQLIRSSTVTVTPINVVPTSEATTVADQVVQHLHQLPLQTQHQVLDFVEFLLNRHRVDVADQIIEANYKDEEPLWDAAMDDDWLALKAALAQEKAEQTIR